MASSIDAIQTKKLEELLECSLCLETLNDPRTLPCFHSFCKCCLEKFVQGQGNRDENPDQGIKNFECPNCRSEFTVDPKEGAAGIGTNYFIRNMLDVMAVESRVKGIPCVHCENPSVARCVTCDVFLCEKCLEGHNNYVGFQNHSVLSMDELSEPKNRFKIRGTPRCKEHDEALKHFCETCEELICRDCKDYNHNNHKCSPLKKAAEEKMEELNTHYRKLTEEVTEVNNALEAMTGVDKSLEANVKTAKQKISARKEEILEAVRKKFDEKEKSLLREIDIIYLFKHKAIEEQLKDTEAYVKKIKNSVDMCAGLLKNGNPVEIASSHKQVCTNIENVRKERPENLKPDNDGGIPFNSCATGGLDAEIEKISQRMGNIKMEETSKVMSGTSRPGSSSADYSAKGSRPCPVSCWDTVPYMAKYIKTFYNENLKKIEEYYNVKITWAADDNKVTIQAADLGTGYDHQKFNLGCEQFMAIYCDLYKNVTKVIFNVSQDGEGYSKATLEKAVCSVPKVVNGLILEKAADGTTYELWGKSASLTQGQDWIRSQLGIPSSNHGARPPPAPKSLGSPPTSKLPGLPRPRQVTRPFPQVARSFPKPLGEKLVHETPNKIKVLVYEGDITRENADIIVNACNKHLDHGGGVSRAISTAGGPDVQRESDAYIKKHGDLATGDVAVTGSGLLKCINIVHAVGPRWAKHGQKGSIKLLKKVFRNVFQSAERLGAKSVAMPAISTGIYGVPKDVCAQTVFSFIDELDQSLTSKPTGPYEIRLVNFDMETAKAFRKEFHKWAIKGKKVERRHSFKDLAKNEAKSPVLARSVDDMHKTPRIKDPLIASNASSKKSSSNGSSSPSSRQPGSSSSGTKRNRDTATLAGVARSSSASSSSSGQLGSSSLDTKRNEIKTTLASVARTNSPSSSASSSSSQQPENSSSVQSHSVATHTVTVLSRPGHAQKVTNSSNNQLVNGDPDASANRSSSTQHALSGSRMTTQYGQNGSPATTKAQTSSNDCPICQCPVTNQKSLRCGHIFCKPCIEKAFTFQKKCPVCQVVYGITEGDQPDGTMRVSRNYYQYLPGYEGHGTYVISYSIASGKQGSRHPKPGHRFQGTSRQAYLPATREGEVVLKLLQKAFDKKLIFTVGRSTTTGMEDCVTWNDIHHKTSMSGGPQRFGYPDPGYLARVKDELKAKGIVPE